MRTVVARYSSWFAGFTLFAIVVMLAVLGWQIDRRTEAIDTINESAQRIETAAVHTEQVLLEVVEAQRTPEAIAQQQAVREALSQIRQIHTLLCQTPELAESEECP